MKLLRLVFPLLLLMLTYSASADLWVSDGSRPGFIHPIAQWDPYTWGDRTVLDYRVEFEAYCNGVRFLAWSRSGGMVELYGERCMVAPEEGVTLFRGRAHFVDGTVGDWIEASCESYSPDPEVLFAENVSTADTLLLHAEWSPDAFGSEPWRVEMQVMVRGQVCCDATRAGWSAQEVPRRTIVLPDAVAGAIVTFRARALYPDGSAGEWESYSDVIRYGD